MMSPVKLRVLVSGLLVLCLLSLFWTDHGDAVIGLTELVAASGAWACAVWLWNESGARRFGTKISNQTRAVALIIWAVISRLALYAMYLTVPVIILTMALGIGPWSKEAVREREFRKISIQEEQKRKVLAPFTEPVMREYYQEEERKAQERGKEFRERMARLEKEFLNYKGDQTRDEWMLDQIANGN